MSKSGKILYTDPLESIYNEVKNLLLDNGKLKLQLEELQRDHLKEKKTLLMNLIALSDNIFNILKEEKPINNSLNTLYNILLRSLKDFNVLPFTDDEYDRLNHDIHLAVEIEKNRNFDDGKITEVIKKGFRLNGELLRAGEVKVVANK